MAFADQDLDFTVWAIMGVTPERAYEAVADPEQLSRHFTMGGAKGRAETGAVVTWEFADFPGPFDVRVIEAVPTERIVLEWPHPTEKAVNRVTFRFEPVDERRCKVSVTETGWTAEPEDLGAAFGNCMGWSHMLSAMKAWLDHGIQLRPGMFR